MVHYFYVIHKESYHHLSVKLLLLSTQTMTISTIRSHKNKLIFVVKVNLRLTRHSVKKPHIYKIQVYDNGKELENIE